MKNHKQNWLLLFFIALGPVAGWSQQRADSTIVNERRTMNLDSLINDAPVYGPDEPIAVPRAIPSDDDMSSPTMPDTTPITAPEVVAPETFEDDYGTVRVYSS